MRNVIHGFNAQGLAVLQEGSSHPHRLRTTFTQEGTQRLKELLHRSPRDFGKERSTWTLELAAQVSFEQGIISPPVSDESVRRALQRLKTSWKRAKHWIISPDPQYLLKKPTRPVDGLGQPRAELGHWLSRRGVVESLRIAPHARLTGRKPPASSGGAVLANGGQGRPYPALLFADQKSLTQSDCAQGVHGKRAIVEPDGPLSAQQLAERICSHFSCSYEPHLSIPEKVS